MSADGKPVFTIGHSTHSESYFLELLAMHGADVVGDVRSVPYSRFNPQFNRETLEEALKRKGLRYVFLGKELGARSEDRSCYFRGRVQYARLAQTALFQSGIDRVIDGAKRYRIALMCAEKEPLECHRALLVAGALASHGIPIFHIHADGHIESHEEAMIRLLRITGIPRQDLFRSTSDLLAEALARQEELVAYVDEKLSTGAVREEAE